MKAVILYGSKSVEHEISIISALQTYNKLSKFMDVELVYITKDLSFLKGDVLKDIKNYSNEKKIKQKTKKVTIKKDGFIGKIKYDIYIPILHGTFGEDGNIFGYLNMLNCPYIGSGFKSSVIGHNKYLMKLILEDNNLKTLKFKYLRKKEFYENDNSIFELTKDFNFPLIIKATSLGSSIGVKKVYKKDIVIELREIFKFDDEVIIEEFIEDFIEVNQSAYMSDCIKLSNLEQINSNKDIYTYEEKYNSYDKLSYNNNNILTIKDDIIEIVNKTTKRIYDVFNLSSIVRIDYIIYKDNVYVNEINMIPGSLSAHLYDNDISKIIKEISLVSKKINNYIFQDSLVIDKMELDKFKK